MFTSVGENESDGSSKFVGRSELPRYHRSRRYLRNLPLQQPPLDLPEPPEPQPVVSELVPMQMPTYYVTSTTTLRVALGARTSKWSSVRERTPQMVAQAKLETFRTTTELGLNKESSADFMVPTTTATTMTTTTIVKSSFSDVVKTAMLVRNWMTAMEHDGHEEDPARESMATLTAFELEHDNDEQAILGTDNETFTDHPTVAFRLLVIFIFDDVFKGYFFPWILCNATFDIIFILDILVQSRTTFMFDGSEVKNTKKMWKNYADGSRVYFDFACLLPLDFVLFANPTISMLRAVRILKAYRLLDFVESTQKRTPFPHATKIASLMTACYVLFHWNACVYFLFSLFEGLSEDNTNAFGFSYYKVFDPRFPSCNVGFLSSPAETSRGKVQAYFDENCWYEEDTSVLDIDEERPKYMQEMFDYWTNRGFNKFEMGNFSREYSMSIYWSSLTITTCGQQPWPSTSPQNMLEVLDTLIGVLVFATIIGSVGNVVTQMNQNVYEFREKMDAIKFYMKYRNVHTDIQERVLTCFMYMNTHNQLKDEKEVLDVLPPRFQGHIAVNLHMDTLKQVQLFSTCDTGFLYEVVQLVKQQVYSPNDYLCRKNEKAKEMFIVKKGILSVIDDDTGVELETLYEGATFGELSIVNVRGNLLGDRRSVSLRSVGYSDVYVLNQDDVTRTLQEYPKDRESLIRNARQMLHERGLLETTELGEVDYDNFDAEDETMIELLSVDEQLTRLSNIVRDLDHDLTNVIDSFAHMAQHWKQRVTSLENTFNYNKKRIRRDCIRGIFDQMKALDVLDLRATRSRR